MNPYATPTLDDNPLLAPLYEDEAREQVRLPAYGLIGSACFAAVLCFVAIVFALLAPIGEDRALISPEVDRLMTLMAGILLLAVQAVIFRGGWALLRLEPYRAARWGAILAIVSLGGACIVGLPFGVWALLRLYDGRIRGAFLHA